ncbi:Zn(2)-C6 fungal-type DNA-binding domain protein [Niveomyces insectorum RCEF 264]|uniref:Zn(2)-C6 fungal-type DNA-binding domain protein n=1 Tax=Niveomyces insectorum RCEF 264 TaxID=1081102 RepID=A0A167T8G1_9HYPO|nr:Zn(2)-C6 fungal-type DNA-binding domain protein [Niveomyces insectorum RCEF 264]
MNSNKRQRTDGDTTARDRRQEQHDGAVKPQLTRACAECKRQKVRCYFVSGQTACSKCAKSGIQCVPHNFAQKFMDDDAIWKADAAETIARLTAAVNHLLEHNSLPPLLSYGDSSRQTNNDKNRHCTANTNKNGNGSPGVASTRMPVSERPEDGAASVITAPSAGSPTTSPLGSSRDAATAASGNFISEGPSADLREDDSDLVPLPMNNLYSLTEPAKSLLIRVNPTCVNGPDFISRGVVSLDEAQFLFGHFIEHINPLLWDGMLCAHTTLEAARSSSSLLVATVLTVAAMHLSGGKSETEMEAAAEPGKDQERQQRTPKRSLLHTTYDAFVQLMRASCLLRSQNLDDVRGLCIGAFYLTSLSWALCSRAIRVATEMNLHKSSLQFAASGSSSTPSPSSSAYGREQYERVQLWYVLYVCDHQFALAYGRPPMMHEDAAIRNADKLLAMSGGIPASSSSVPAAETAAAAAPWLSTNQSLTSAVLSASRAARGNWWLVAQVKLFRILAGAYFLYGCDPDLALGGEEYERLQSFNLQLDQWRLEEQQQQQLSTGLNRVGGSTGRTADHRPLWDRTGGRDLGGNRPAPSNKVTALYYHLARFHLNSLSLRGISAGGAGTNTATSYEDQHGADLNMSWERQEVANNAIAAATSTIRLVVEDIDLRTMLIGMPIFVHAMIAVCASFLLKMAVVFSPSVPPGAITRASIDDTLHLPRDLACYGLNFHTKNALADVKSLVRVLGVAADNASQQHVARQVVTGLRELLQRFCPGDGADSFVYIRSNPNRSVLAAEGTYVGVGSNSGSGFGNAGGPGSTIPLDESPTLVASRQGSETGYINQALMMQLQQQQHQPGSSSLSGFGNGNSGHGNAYYAEPPQSRAAPEVTTQVGVGVQHQEDPFNLMGDLDWRFNDAFLWGIQTDPPLL